MKLPFNIPKKIIININNNDRFKEIDFIKSISIISVIIIHSNNIDTLFLYLSPFHIWQAVPIFIMIAGINSTLSSYGKIEFSLKNEYSIYKLNKYLKRIFIPFLLFFIFELFILFFKNEATIKKIIFYFFTGGIGPGSFYIPIFIQHILIFPLILFVKNKFSSNNKYIVIFSFFLFSILIEWIHVIYNTSEVLYRISYTRYIFSSIIGSYIVSDGFDSIHIIILSALSLLYITIVSYMKYSFIFIYPAWNFQHAPSYFYTAFLIYILWLIYPIFSKFDNILIPIGKASYHIFLFQMVWFWIFSGYLRHLIEIDIIYITSNILICLTIGYCLYKIQFFTMRKIQSRYVNKYNSPDEIILAADSNVGWIPEADVDDHRRYKRGKQ